MTWIDLHPSVEPSGCIFTESRKYSGTCQAMKTCSQRYEVETKALLSDEKCRAFQRFWYDRERQNTTGFDDLSYWEGSRTPKLWSCADSPKWCAAHVHKWIWRIWRWWCLCILANKTRSLCFINVCAISVPMQNKVLIIIGLKRMLILHTVLIAAMYFSLWIKE